jgi:DNA modification methylase
LGAIACDRVRKYIGCDPGVETFKGLERMRDELLSMAQKMGRSLNVEIYRLGSETQEMRRKLTPNSVGLVFSSPPYFSQEVYSDDPDQSWKKYPAQESWLNGFMGATLDNCRYALKPGGILAVNIANVSTYRGSLQDDFLALAERKGFMYIETLQLQLSAMPGTKQKHGKHKHEPVYVFAVP